MIKASVFCFVLLLLPATENMLRGQPPAADGFRIVFDFPVSGTQAVKPVLKTHDGQEVHCYGKLKDAVPQGKWICKYDNGKTYTRFGYHKGVLEGKANVWYPNGAKREQVNYKNGMLDGPVKSWYESGRIESSVTCKMGKPEGTAYYYYESGSTRWVINYVDGLREGEFRERYSNNKIKTRISFHKDLPEGPGVQYYENGSLMITCNWAAGAVEGTYKEFHSNGKLRLLGRYTADKADSTFISYDSTGKVKQVEQYSLGVRAGVWTKYDEQGRPETKDKYTDGKLVGTEEFNGGILKKYSRSSGDTLVITTYYDNGAVNRDLFLLGKIPLGYRQWSVSGTLQQEERGNGTNGLLSIYGENGKLLEQGPTLLGLKQGEFIRYDEKGKKIKKLIFENGRLMREESLN